MEYLSKYIFSNAHQSTRHLTEGSCPVVKMKLNPLPKAG